MFDYKKNPDGTYKVWNALTGHIYAYNTTNPYKVMYAVEVQIPKKRKVQTRDLYLQIMDERKKKK